MKPLVTIPIPEVLELLKKYLQLDITRATAYYWMKSRGFPKSTGLGKPRRWRKDLVMKWIANQIKNSAQ